MTGHPRRNKPSHITLHRQWMAEGFNEPWVIAVRMIREVLPPPRGKEAMPGMGSQVQIAADYWVQVRETPEEVAVLIRGEEIPE